MARTLTALLLACLARVALAQPADPLQPDPNGPRRADPTHLVFLGATVHVAPGRVIESGLVEIRDTRITLVADLSTIRDAPPPGSRVIDAAGRHIYAGFIDAHVPVNTPAPDLNSPGAHWNGRVTPQRSALDAAGPSPDDSKKLRALGFTAGVIAPADGLFAGRAALVSLAEPSPDASDSRPPVYRADVYHALALDASSAPTRGQFTEYPDSQMGAIALIRQTLSDADRRDALRSNPGSPDAALAQPSALDALSRDAKLPLAFRTRTELEALRAAKIAREFRRSFAVVGSGAEFRRLDALRADLADAFLILPITLPETPDVSSIGAADAIDLRELLTWEQAPTNPRRLAEAGLRVALTASGLNKKESFADNLQKAIDLGGLTHDQALAMLTTSPAAWLGASDILGTVEPGRIANLIIADGPLFQPRAAAPKDAKPAKVLDVYVDGIRHEINPPPPPFDGAWTLTAGDFRMTLVITGDKITATEGEGENANTGDARNVSIRGNSISFTLDDTDDGSGSYLHTGTLGPDAVIRGTILLPDAATLPWSAARAEPAQPDESDDQPDEAPEEPDAPTLPPEQLPGYPFGPYARTELPPQETVIFHNAAIWTSGPEGVIERGWIMLDAGRIAMLGEGDPEYSGPANPRYIDLAGAHVTPGIIDAHSHTGISGGVNEAGQAVTAEVRIADVTDPDSINWYRQLAGGVTVVNSMHGSANPIGGQTQTNKIRWGVPHPDQMHLEDARPGIKFALGENVKQSNWGDGNTTRYPQTRMGVETIIRDRFTAAREYLEELEATKGELPFRRDLELEALAEILAGERLVHCHSYRQDEILMLCRVAEDFDFTIGTFQHGLEVYKVAEHARRAAIGASLFADWWAYKVEVQDAIPFAGPLQAAAGVLTSYNSDSDELARRLNVEAAKAVRYSSLPGEDSPSGFAISPENALKFVTINPATQLGIDARVGSLEPGKDADLAIWSGPPLSGFSRCLATWIDGRELYSVERDAELRARNAEHRARILQRIIGEGAEKPKDEPAAEDAPADPPRSLIQRLAADARRRHALDLYLRAVNPADHRCADCGTSLLGESR